MKDKIIQYILNNYSPKNEAEALDVVCSVRYDYEQVRADAPIFVCNLMRVSPEEWFEVFKVVCQSLVSISENAVSENVEYRIGDLTLEQFTRWIVEGKYVCNLVNGEVAVGLSDRVRANVTHIYRDIPALYKRFISNTDYTDIVQADVIIPLNAETRVIHGELSYKTFSEIVKSGYCLYLMDDDVRDLCEKWVDEDGILFIYVDDTAYESLPLRTLYQDFLSYRGERPIFVSLVKHEGLHNN